MSEDKTRVRFAPAPTGMMHLGNIRIALMNYLFAKQKNGSFVLRIEDTDPERNFDPGAKKIQEDLSWLHLEPTEGPSAGGPYAPYYQSERTSLYQEKLDYLITKKNVYRCFCSPEELDKKRKRQIALKMPPRYDRTCLELSENEIEQKLQNNIPFVWRFKISPDQVITVHDLAKGKINFEMNNFSDFPVTRTNGTFTFLFANAIDDILMQINHVLRGEDHLSNTANQAAIVLALGGSLPIYWHLPILCNINGKKLSKRDFGFSLRDLKDAGFLPEAIDNYLAIIGGSFEHEIMNLNQLVTSYDFESISQSGSIKYDVDKLKWVNHKWIERYEPKDLASVTLPFLIKEYPQAEHLNHAKLVQLLQTIKSEMITLQDSVEAARFYFEPPQIAEKDIIDAISEQTYLNCKKIILNNLGAIRDEESFLNTIKSDAKKDSIKAKDLFLVLRMVLMGAKYGPSIGDVLTLLGHEESKRRIEAL